MRVIKNRVTRREVITFYCDYDRQKKGQSLISNLNTWNWNDPNEIDKNLKQHNLKTGVLAAYRSWQLVQLDFIDIMDCAIVNSIFSHKFQCLGKLIGKSHIESFKPNGSTNWWTPISSGSNISEDSALILRPSVKSEFPAKWYIEDGSGRTIALMQRMLKHNEFWRTAFAYMGVIPDEDSKFIKTRPELAGR